MSAPYISSELDDKGDVYHTEDQTPAQVLKNDVASSDSPATPATLAIGEPTERNVKLHDISFKTWGAVIALFFTSFGSFSTYLLVLSSSSVVGAAVGDTDSIHVGWYGTSYGVAQVVTQILAGSLSDIFGRRYFFLGGTSLAIIACVVGATAKTGNAIIVSMTILGFSAGLQGLGAAAMAEILPNKYKPFTSGLQEISIALWQVFAGLFAYLLAGVHETRADFIIGCGLHVFSLTLTALYYWPPVNPTGKNKWEELRKLDFIGVLLLVGGAVSLLLGLSFGGGNYGWHSGTTWGPITAGLALLIILGVWEWRALAGVPLFPRVLFRYKRNFVFMLFDSFVLGFILIAGSAMWPIFITNVWNSNGTKVGLYTVPQGVGQFVGNAGISFLTRFLRFTNAQLLLGFALCAIFTGLLGTLGPDDLHKGLALSVFQGLGVGISIVMITVHVIFSVPQEYLGTAIGLVNGARSIGGSCGVAIYVAIFSTGLTNNAGSIAPVAIQAGVNPADLQAVIGAGIGGGYDALLGVGLTPQQASTIAYAVKGVWATSFQKTFYTASGFCGAAFLLSLAARDVTKYFNNVQAVNLDEGGRNKTIAKGTIAEQTKQVHNQFEA